tara:strand:- start:962 stop:1285 length:324 start_codon:yes stop_codon:yes gene_type:complete
VKYLIPLFILFGCNMNQNYDKSMLLNADPLTLSKINSRGLMKCMQLPTPLPPVPINKDHKVSNEEVYDQADCIDSEMSKNETDKINSERKEKKKFNLEINLEDQDKE